MPTPTEQLLAEIDQFCARHEMNATQFGREALRDPRFVHELRNGRRQPRLDTADRVKRYMGERDAAALVE